MRRLLIAGLAIPLLHATAMAQPKDVITPPPQPNKGGVIAPPASMDNNAVIPPQPQGLPNAGPTNPTTIPPHVMTPKTFTQRDARHLLETSGYRNVSAMKQERDGTWWGTARKGDITRRVGVDRDGKILVP